MPICFDLEELRKTYNCVNYFETGLFDPTADISVKQALKCNFNKVYSIELFKQWVDLAKIEFDEEIKNNKIQIIFDDSSNIKKYIVNNEDFEDKRAVFFLDAHVDNVNIKNYTTECPLMNELNGISMLKRKDHILLIDDLRILKTKNPWNDKSLGDVNYIDLIIKKIKTINNNYKFTTLDGIQKNDVLCAYI